MSDFRVATGADLTLFPRLHLAPDGRVWQEDFGRLAGDAYDFRGVEVTLQGAVDWLDGALTVLANEHRPAVRLAPLKGADLVQRRRDSNGATEPPTQAELLAFEQLTHQRQQAPGKMEVTVTGPLQKTQSGFVLKVRCHEFGP